MPGVFHLTKVLFISGSIGTGHVTRDLAIAKEFRTLRPYTEIVWLAGEPAVTILKNAGEKLLPEAGEYNKDTATAISSASGFDMNLSKHLMKSNKIWKAAY
jgi:spore coat polysaccharide biosynthesis predicted glycosyltransferase SpsG